MFIASNVERIIVVILKFTAEFTIPLKMQDDKVVSDLFDQILKE